MYLYLLSLDATDAHLMRNVKSTIQSRKTENYFTRQSYMNNGLEQFSHWSANFVQTAILMCQHLGNESVSKIVINDTINFLFKLKSAFW